MVCIIATNVAPRELLWRPNKRTRFGVGGPSSLWHEQITDHCLDFGFEDHDDRGYRLSKPMERNESKAYSPSNRPSSS